MLKNKLMLIVVCAMLFIGIWDLFLQETSVLQRTLIFSKRVIFVKCDTWVKYLDISSESRFRLGTRLFTDDRVPGFPGVQAAVDGDSLYVGAETILYEFDSSFNVLRQVCVSEFGFDASNYRFGLHAYAYNGTLWITVTHEAHPDCQPLYHRVIQWNTTAPPDTGKVSPQYNRYRRWTVDVASNTLYVPSAKEHDTLRYCFDTEQVEYKSYGLYSHADIQDNMLLLSGSPRLRNYPIALIDLDTEECVYLDTGAFARWGREGMIYYCKGTTQLWQMDIANQQPHLLYRTTRFPSYRLWAADIELSESGRFLSFSYSDPKWFIWDDRNCIVIDLKENTYRALPHTYFFVFSSTLWESDQMNHRNKQIQVDDTLTD